MNNSAYSPDSANPSAATMNGQGGTARPRYDMLQVVIARAPGYGLGIAIAGGTDNPNHSSGDPTVIVTDVIKGGPAESKLRPNDKIVSVNGVALENVEHAFAARVLKECGAQATLVVRRPVSSQPNGHGHTNGHSGQTARSRLSYPPPTSHWEPTFNTNTVNASPNPPESQLNPSASVVQSKPNGETDGLEQVVLHRHGSALPEGVEIGCQFYVKRVDESLLGHLSVGDTLLRVGHVQLDSPYMSADDVRRLLVDQARAAESVTLLVDRAPDLPAPRRDQPPPRPPLPTQFVPPRVSGAPAADYQPVAARFGTAATVRRAVLDKSAAGSFGLRLVGGSGSGLFVGSTQPGSSAASHLVEGDRLLAIGQLDLLGPPKRTKEDALRALLSAPRRVEVAWTAARDQYEQLVASGEFGDHLFVRVHFYAVYRRSNAAPLELRYNDVYHIVSTAYGGQLGTWLGAKLDQQLRESARTELPNLDLACQLCQQSRLALAHGDSLSHENEHDGPNTNTILRRLKRIAISAHAHAHTQSPDDAARVREAVLLSTRFAAYEHVEARPADFVRPVVVYGPLAHVAREHLLRFYAAKYEATNVQVGHTESDVDVQAETGVREALEHSKHCVLDVPLTTVDWLNYSQLHPIVLFLRPSSRQQLKDLRVRHTSNEPDMSFESAVALERECAFLFTAVLPLSNDDAWLKQLDEMISQQQACPVWHVTATPPPPVHSSASAQEEQSANVRHDLHLSMNSVPEHDVMTTSAYSYLHPQMNEHSTGTQKTARTGKATNSRMHQSMVEGTKVNTANSRLSLALPNFNYYPQPQPQSKRAAGPNGSTTLGVSNVQPQADDLSLVTHSLAESTARDAAETLHTRNDNEVCQKDEQDTYCYDNATEQCAAPNASAILEQPADDSCKVPPGCVETDANGDGANIDSSKLPVVASARGVFDERGGLLQAPESDVCLLVPPGAIEEGNQVELYFNVCANDQEVPPLTLNEKAGEQLLSPLVMCGPRGLSFRKPVELRLPHRNDLDPAEWSFTLKSSESFRDTNERWRDVPLRADSIRGDEHEHEHENENEQEQDVTGRMRPKYVSVYIDHF